MEERRFRIWICEGFKGERQKEDWYEQAKKTGWVKCVNGEIIDGMLIRVGEGNMNLNCNICVNNLKILCKFNQ